jgi:flavin-dependent dehydrogenase
LTDARRPTPIDAVVIGGGPAGAVAALTLARDGRRVLLADALSVDLRAGRVKIGEALPPAVQPLLKDLGLWDRFIADGHLPSPGTVATWGSPHPASVDFILDPNGHGWHLDRLRFDRLLRRSAYEAGVDVREDCHARVLARADDGTWEVELKGRSGDCDTIGCRLFLDATGRRSGPARWVGARRRRRDSAIGVYAAFEANPGDLDARTLVEAAPDGWWYTALVPGGRRIAAYMTDAELLPAAMRTLAGYCAALKATHQIRLHMPVSRVRLEGAPRVAAAHGSCLEPVAGNGWLALGDAALAFDPLSSQGILTALFTGIAGARAADAQIAGDYAPTEDYVRRLEQIWCAYQRNRIAYYGLERRWPDRRFWALRHREGQLDQSQAPVQY